MYFTRYNHHTNKIFIDKIIIDDFWEITHNFYTPISIPDTAYNNPAQVGEGEWIQCTKTKYNIVFPMGP